MNRTVAQIAEHYIKGPQIPEGVLNRLEAGIRAFDPCLSCSTHAVGHDAAARPARRARWDGPARGLARLRGRERHGPDSGGKILVIGYGNTLRRDDGAGMSDRRRDRALEPPGVLASWGPPAHARTWLADRGRGAGHLRGCPGRGGTIGASQVEALEPLVEGGASLIHSLSPRSAPGSDPRPFHRCPAAWLVSVPAEDFAFGEGLSATAELGLRGRRLVSSRRDRPGPMPRTSKPRRVSQRRCPAFASPSSLVHPVQDPDHEHTHPPGGRLHQPPLRRQPGGGLPARGPRRGILDAGGGGRDEPLGDGLPPSARGRPGVPASAGSRPGSRSTSAAMPRWRPPTCSGRRGSAAETRPLRDAQRPALGQAQGRLDRARLPRRARRARLTPAELERSPRPCTPPSSSAGRNRFDLLVELADEAAVRRPGARHRPARGDSPSAA